MRLPSQSSDTAELPCTMTAMNIGEGNMQATIYHKCQLWQSGFFELAVLHSD